MLIKLQKCWQLQQQQQNADAQIFFLIDDDAWFLKKRMLMLGQKNSNDDAKAYSTLYNPGIRLSEFCSITLATRVP